jgi:hypothetical protein
VDTIPALAWTARPDGTVICLPPIPELDGTFEYLVAAGVVSLDTPATV